MGKIPEAPGERAAWLEQWAAEQRKRLGDRDPLRERLQLRIDKMIERQIERLDPHLDRGLDTSHNLYLPRTSQIYVAGPSRWDVLPRALRKIGTSDHDVFVDFGCGKGRVVHQAAKRRLKRVIGVEIIPEVAELARKLVATHREKYRCQSVEILTCDAAEFRVPDDVTIAYHAYGFLPKTLDAVLRQLVESIERRPRHLRLIYYRPQSIAQVLVTERFRLLSDISFGATAIFESC